MNWELFVTFLLITMILVVTPGPIVTLVIAVSLAAPRVRSDSLSEKRLLLLAVRHGTHLCSVRTTLSAYFLSVRDSSGVHR